jgi:hypothetical protein
VLVWVAEELGSSGTVLVEVNGGVIVEVGCGEVEGGTVEVKRDVAAIVVVVVVVVVVVAAATLGNTRLVGSFLKCKP